MGHQEVNCLHNMYGVLVVFGVLASILLGILMLYAVSTNISEWKYYSKYYKTLKSKQYVYSSGQYYVWSTQDGILPEFQDGVSFNIDDGMIRTNDFLLTKRFPECFDPYQLYWYYKYWLYYKIHIKHTLNLK